MTVTSDPRTWGARNAHDPTVVRGDDGLWYMFSTDAASDVDEIPTGVHVRTSSDLVEWVFRGTALDGVPGPAGAWSGAVGLWAPEVVRWPTADGTPRWHMYYSASTFGSRTSAIGLAVADTPAGPWHDQGLVVATRHESDTHNAIDAAVAFDRDGRPWMIYGSFFDGIHIVALSPETGLRVRDEKGTLIARRPASVDGAVEGAYVLYRPEEDRFVLFLSYDSLADAYSVRVGIADEITGPYRDAAGTALTSPDDAHAVAAGTKVLGGHRFPGGAGLIAPGHNSIFRDGDDTFMVHHVRCADAPRRHEAQIRRVHFTRDGWPLVSPFPYAGAERERLGAVVAADGRWQAVRLRPEIAGMIAAEPVDVWSTLATAGETVAGNLTLTTATETVVVDGAVFGAWDPVAGRSVPAFAGLDAEGVVWMGAQEVLG